MVQKGEGREGSNDLPSVFTFSTRVSTNKTSFQIGDTPSSGIVAFGFSPIFCVFNEYLDCL